MLDARGVCCIRQRARQRAVTTLLVCVLFCFVESADTLSATASASLSISSTPTASRSPSSQRSFSRSVTPSRDDSSVTNTNSATSKSSSESISLSLSATSTESDSPDRTSWTSTHSPNTSETTSASPERPTISATRTLTSEQSNTVVSATPSTTQLLSYTTSSTATTTVTPPPTPSRTPSWQQSRTESLSSAPSVSHTVSRNTLSTSRSPSRTTVTPPPTPSKTSNYSGSDSVTASDDPSLSLSRKSPSKSQTTVSRSGATRSPTQSGTARTESKPGSVTDSASPSLSALVSISMTYTATLHTPSSSETINISGTRSHSKNVSRTHTVTLNASETSSYSPNISKTASATKSPTLIRTRSPSDVASHSVSTSTSRSLNISHSTTVTATITASKHTLPDTVTVSDHRTASASSSATITSSASKTSSRTGTRSFPTRTPSRSGSRTQQTCTLNATITYTLRLSVTPSSSSSRSKTRGTATPSFTNSTTVTSTQNVTATKSLTATIDPCNTTFRGDSQAFVDSVNVLSEVYGAAAAPSDVSDFMNIDRLTFASIGSIRVRLLFNTLLRNFYRNTSLNWFPMPVAENCIVNKAELISAYEVVLTISYDPEVSLYLQVQDDYDCNITFSSDVFQCQALTNFSFNFSTAMTVSGTPQGFPSLMKIISSLATSALAMLSGGGASLLTQSRAGSLAAFASCQFSLVQPLEVQDSPTQIGFGSYVHFYNRGAVVGNLSFIVAMMVIMLLVLLALTVCLRRQVVVYECVPAKKTTKATESNLNSMIMDGGGDVGGSLDVMLLARPNVSAVALEDPSLAPERQDDADARVLEQRRETVGEAFVRLCSNTAYPSIGLVLLLWLVDSTTTASVRLLRYPFDAYDRYIGAAGLAVYTLLFVSSAFLCIVVVRRKESRVKIAGAEGLLTSPHPLARIMRWWMLPPYELVPLKKRQQRFYSMMAYLFSESRFAFFICIDLGLSFLMAILVGMAVSKPEVCFRYALIAVVGYFVFFVLLVVLRPQLTRFSLALNVLTSMLGLTSSIMILVAMRTGSTKLMLATQYVNITLLYVSSLQMISTVFGIVIWMHQNRIKHHRRRKHKQNFRKMYRQANGSLAESGPDSSGGEEENSPSASIAYLNKEADVDDLTLIVDLGHEKDDPSAEVEMRAIHQVLDVEDKVEKAQPSNEQQEESGGQEGQVDDDKSATKHEVPKHSAMEKQRAKWIAKQLLKNHKAASLAKLKDAIAAGVSEKEAYAQHQAEMEALILNMDDMHGTGRVAAGDVDASVGDEDEEDMGLYFDEVLEVWKLKTSDDDLGSIWKSTPKPASYTDATNQNADNDVLADLGLGSVLQGDEASQPYHSIEISTAPYVDQHSTDNALEVAPTTVTHATHTSSTDHHDVEVEVVSLQNDEVREREAGRSTTPLMIEVPNSEANGNVELSAHSSLPNPITTVEIIEEDVVADTAIISPPVEQSSSHHVMQQQSDDTRATRMFTPADDGGEPPTSSSRNRDECEPTGQVNDPLLITEVTETAPSSVTLADRIRLELSADEI